jgi:hypothetical protein
MPCFLMVFVSEKFNFPFVILDLIWIIAEGYHDSTPNKH